MYIFFTWNLRKMMVILYKFDILGHGNRKQLTVIQLIVPYILLLMYFNGFFKDKPQVVLCTP